MSTKEKIIRIFSVLFLGGLTILYLARGAYYYVQENGWPFENKDRAFMLYEKLVDDKNPTNFGDGLNFDKESKTYSYYGKAEKNYISYAGQIWRIMGIDSENNITMVIDKPITLLNYQGAFYDSKVGKWLNDEATGVFNKIFPDLALLADQKVCLDVKSEDDLKNINGTYACAVKEKTTKIGMLDLEDYLNTGAAKSYLNNGTTFWLANQNQDGSNWFVSDKGGLNSDSQKNMILGVRPTITISANIEWRGGKGTSENPYLIEQKFITYLNDGMIGDYLTYNNELWRIAGKDKENVKVVKEGYIGEDLRAFSGAGTSVFSLSDKKGIAYYLNNTYLNSLDNKDVVSGTWNNGSYNTNDAFDYNTIKKKIVVCKVGLLNIGDFYVGDYPNVITMTQEYGYVKLYSLYAINEDNQVFVDLPSGKYKVRPALYLAGQTVVTDGSGLKNDPFVLGDKNVNK